MWTRMDRLKMQSLEKKHLILHLKLKWLYLFRSKKIKCRFLTPANYNFLKLNLCLIEHSRQKEFLSLIDSIRILQVFQNNHLNNLGYRLDCHRKFQDLLVSRFRIHMSFQLEDQQLLPKEDQLWLYLKRKRHLKSNFPHNRPNLREQICNQRNSLCHLKVSRHHKLQPLLKLYCHRCSIR